jgi:hypothetical protein
MAEDIELFAEDDNSTQTKKQIERIEIMNISKATRNKISKTGKKKGQLL